MGVGGGYNRMNISYQREMKRNYLIVETEKRDEIPFEQNMLEQNQIDGVLHFQVRKKIRISAFFMRSHQNSRFSVFWKDSRYRPGRSGRW